MPLAHQRGDREAENLNIEPVEQNRERILRQIERLVRASIEEGQLPAELDAELAARMVRDLGEEAGRMILTDPKHYTPDRYERFVQSVVRLILPR